MCFFLADKRLPQDYPLYGGFGKDEDGFWHKNGILGAFARRQTIMWKRSITFFS